MRVEQYEEALKQTVQFLKRPRTAAEVAERFSISRFAAYERIGALRKRRSVVSTGTITGPESKTGPKAKAWVAV